MDYIKLEQNQEVHLLPRSGATPTQAIHGAMLFCSENNLIGCTLYYKGFTMYIDKESNLKNLVSEYSDWAALNCV